MPIYRRRFGRGVLHTPFLDIEAANDGRMNAQAEPAGDRANEVEPRPNLVRTSPELRLNPGGTKKGEAIRNTLFILYY